MANPVSGFSKKSKQEKIDWLVANYLTANNDAETILKKYWNTDEKTQQLHDEFIENTLTNYYLPFGIAPNFLINNKLYALPMVIEESSVVAAASNAAKFWLDKGGFKAEVVSTLKNGQVHLNYFGKREHLTSFFFDVKPKLIAGIASIEKNMKKRGGGLVSIELINKTEALEGYYELHCTFETLDAMGANFINSCLEAFATIFETEAKKFEAFTTNNTFPEVVMSILSNFVPECLVRAAVCCNVEELGQKDMNGETFANNFVRAIAIANVEPRRAVTHNKGIMNGVDAIVLATGNDFRAVEAGVHAFASKNGHYKSLTNAKITNGIFHYWIEMPLALGTIGGLTGLHPMVKIAMDILQKPTAKQLMEITAVAGLAQNFAALRSLVTVGIQKGHMKMHLMNILNQLNATTEEKEKAATYFSKNAVSHSAVVAYIKNLRK